ncbi:MAG TPA: tetratricopeptide repeat protein [Burkholderiaceae bacterium]|jgi:tetratricopeptide (TPR) repeat protein
MPQFRLSHLALVGALLGLSIAPVFVTGVSTAYAADSVRPEIGKVLQAAQDDIKKQKYKEALGKVHEAEAISGRTSYENYMIDFMRAAASQGAGDYETAAKSYEAVISSGHLAGASQAKIVQALGDMYFREKEYPKAILWLTRYQSESGDTSVRPYLIQSYYFSNDFARAAKEVSADIQAEEKAGRTPSEDQLNMLASCALKQNDKAGYAAAVEKMVAYHPRKELWVDLLNRLESKSGFNDGRLGLDVLRLRYQVGILTKAEDYMNYVELALNSGYPLEAKKGIDAAYKSGVFGTGAEASRQKRLQDLVTKKVAEDAKSIAQTEAEVSKSKDGTGMVNVGYDYVTMGQFDKGIALMEQGIDKGDLKHPDDAKLHLGMAYLQADKKSKALQTFKAVQGTDGTSELAHLWAIAATHPLN